MIEINKKTKKPSPETVTNKKPSAISSNKKGSYGTSGIRINKKSKG